MLPSLRTRQINAAAHQISELMAVTDGDSPAAHAQVVNQNQNGWTLDVSAPRGAVLRSEGVVFTPAELETVWTKAVGIFRS